jgi:hypothetical protein
MIFCEPTPCGKWMLGSMFFLREGKPVFLVSKRKVIRVQREHISDMLEYLAEQILGELSSMASQLGLSQEEICSAMEDVPDQPFERRKNA